jgi:hypothetical protein
VAPVLEGPHFVNGEVEFGEQLGHFSVVFAFLDR